MNKEIKEILDKLKSKKERYEMCIRADISFSDDSYEASLLLDYITNLQQENEIRQQDINNLTYQLAKMKAENERLKEWKEDLLNENIELENIRKETIEFIKEKISSTKGVINDYMYREEHNKHLIELLKEDIEMYKKELNILQNGSDSE